MINPLDMTGRSILVVGASSGIGLAASILLSQLGARVTLVARKRDRLEAARMKLEGKGHLVDVFDVTNYECIPNWMKALAKNFGPFDGLLNCAGKYLFHPVRVLDSVHLEALWPVNVFSCLWLAKGFRQRGVNNSGGAIVFVSSSVGLVGQPCLSGYSASKGAIVSMTRSLAIELARERIRVNCVAPGSLKTAMTDVIGPAPTPEDLVQVENDHPLGFGEPIDVANAAVYLLSPTSKWITGTTLVVDGGYTAH